MESMVTNPEAWDLTVIRAQGLRLMRPEKSWRPIVTVEVDKQSNHETVLGVDGQNPNLKQIFRFYDVTTTSTLEMKVWHRSQSKKKGKKRILVAATTQSLGGLMKKVELESMGKSKGGHLDLRLACQSPSKRGVTSSNSKGHPQNGALLTIKLTPPRNQRNTPIAHPLSNDQAEQTSAHPSTDGQSGYSSETPSSSGSSCSSHAANAVINVHPPSPIAEPSQPELLPLSPPGLRRRRRSSKRTRGYSLFSDDDIHGFDSSVSGSDSDSSSASRSGSASGSFNSSTSAFEDAVRNAPLDSCFDSYSDSDEKPPDLGTGSAIQTTVAFPPLSPSPPKPLAPEAVKWLVSASLLPQHILTHTAATTTLNLNPLHNASSDSIAKPPSDIVPPYTEDDPHSPPPPTSPSSNPSTTRTQNKLWEKFLGNFTFYLELRDAHLDSQFELVLHQLRMEWTFMGGFLAALGAVDVAVLAVGPDSIIPLTPLALRSIALSSIFTGLGTTSLAYFILRYSFAPVDLFRMRALDVYGGFVFFAVAARVPTLCMVGSCLGLLVFLGVVAFEVWPVGVIVVCFLVGVLMSLQFLVYGCHMFVKGVVGVVRKAIGGVRTVVMKMSGGDAMARGTSGVGRGQVEERVGSETVAGPSTGRPKLTRPTAGTSMASV